MQHLRWALPAGAWRSWEYEHGKRNVTHNPGRDIYVERPKWVERMEGTKGQRHNYSSR